MILLSKKSLTIFGLLLALPLACGGEDEPAAARGSAQRGESCRSRADCTPDLACVDHRCSVGKFALSQTGKSCVSTQCQAPEDCCPPPSTLCRQLKQQCDAGNPTACQQHELSCACSATDWVCENDVCYESCQSAADCLTGSGTCTNGRCVECAVKADCPTGQACENQQCVPECKDSAQCPYFHDCVEGACIEAGCKTDRECIAATGSVLAFCRDKECKVPCVSDVECDQPAAYDFLACSGGYCVDVGCETDDQCRLQLNVQPGARLDAVCRAATL